MDFYPFNIIIIFFLFLSKISNQMAWGIFKKIGEGLKKAYNWTKNHIVKPVAKALAPIAKPAAAIAKTLIPGASGIIDIAEKGIEKLSGDGSRKNNNMVGRDGHGIRRIYNSTNPYIHLKE